VSKFPSDVLEAVANEKEVRLTTYGRSTGKESSVTIWIVTDGQKVFIRSGQAWCAHWPQNLLKRPEGTLQLDGRAVRFKSRHITDVTRASDIRRNLGAEASVNQKFRRQRGALRHGLRLRLHLALDRNR